MRPSIKEFVHLFSEEFVAPLPIVEIGALRTEGQDDIAELRPLFPQQSYSGWDMRHGPGVDVIASVHHLPIATGTVGTVLMLETLEHVLDPIASMAEVCRIVRPGGCVIISSQMNFPIHAYPSDYWRFTPMSFDYMMRTLDTRFVFMQGNSENPTVVIGTGMKTKDSAEGDAFRAAIRRVQSRWPDASSAGPLILHESLTADAGQRVAAVDLPALVQGRRITQSFSCDSNGMCRIDLLMSNKIGLNFRHLLFRLYDQSIPTVEIAAYRVMAAHAADDAWLAVPIPIQDDSAQRTYTLAVESPDGDPDEGVSIKASSASYPGGQLRIDDEAVLGSLCFQTYCRAAAIRVGDVQVGEETLARGGGDVPENSRAAKGSDQADLGAQFRALSEQQWEQVRYLAGTTAASFDAMLELARQNHAELLDLQRRTLNASTEKLLARSVRENPITRAIRRLRGPTA